MGRQLFGVRKHPVLGNRVRAEAKTLAGRRAAAAPAADERAATPAPPSPSPSAASPASSSASSASASAAKPERTPAQPPERTAERTAERTQPAPEPAAEAVAAPPPPKMGSIRIHALVEDNDLSKLPDDRDLADRILRACNELQEAMDTAVLAGLIIEPSFSRIEGRLTRAGVKVDSFACSVKVFRKLA